MKRKTIVGILITVFIVAGIILFLSVRTKDKRIPWETIPVEKGNIKVTVTATGTLNPLKSVNVGTQVSGVISKIYVDYNSKVTKGEVIAMLDTRPLKASLDQAKADLARAQASFDQAQRDYKRNKALYEQKIISETDYDSYLSTYEQDKAALEGARVAYDRAKLNLSYATITAPISGVVISRNVDEGQTVAASFSTPTLFVIANDLTKMKIEANVDEADIGQVKDGQSVSFNVDAYPNDTFYGIVDEIRLEPVEVQNVVTYIVVIDVSNKDMLLLPGMTANLTILVQEDKGILKVPLNAVNYNPPMDIAIRFLSPGYLQKLRNEFSKSGSPGSIGSGYRSFAGAENNIGYYLRFNHVWILENDSAKLVRVKEGINDGQFVEISGNGIKAGDNVITGISPGYESASTEKTTRSPFLPSFQRRKR